MEFDAKKGTFAVLFVICAVLILGVVYFVLSYYRKDGQNIDPNSLFSMTGMDVILPLTDDYQVVAFDSSASNVSGGGLVLGPGRYEVSYTVQISSSNIKGGPMSSFGVNLQLNGNEYEGTCASAFLMKQPNASQIISVSKTSVIDVTTAGILRLVAARTTGTAPGDVVGNRSTIVIRSQ